MKKSWRAEGLHEDVQDLIVALYDTALEPERFKQALVKMCDYFGGSACAVGSIDTAGQATACTIRFEEWAERLAGNPDAVQQDNFFLRKLPTLPVGVAVRRQDLVSDTAFYRHWLYHDVLQPHGYDAYMGGALFRTPDSFGVCNFFRSAREDAYSDAEMRVLTVLMGHLARILRVNALLAREERQWLGEKTVIDCLPQGVFFIDGEGKVVGSNAAAQRLMAEEDGLFLRQGRLVCRERSEDDVLQGRLASARGFWRGRFEAGSGGAFRVSRRRKDKSLAGVVCPCSSAPTAPSAGSIAVLVIVSDPTASFVPAEATLRGVYGLTPTEARVCQKLLDGCSIGEAGRLLGMTRNTAATHVKRIFAKTEVSSQVELVKLVLKGPAVMDRKGQSHASDT